MNVVYATAGISRILLSGMMDMSCCRCLYAERVRSPGDHRMQIPPISRQHGPAPSILALSSHRAFLIVFSYHHHSFLPRHLSTLSGPCSFIRSFLFVPKSANLPFRYLPGPHHSFLIQACLSDPFICSSASPSIISYSSNSLHTDSDQLPSGSMKENSIVGATMKTMIPSTSTPWTRQRSSPACTFHS